MLLVDLLKATDLETNVIRSLRRRFEVIVERLQEAEKWQIRALNSSTPLALAHSGRLLLHGSNLKGKPAAPPRPLKITRSLGPWAYGTKKARLTRLGMA